ncbi:MAG: DUF2752 domain-containing protein [Firmicutes bacterium]|nr:DUF2752 domain-containing protein [Bacillota bacterium]
MLDLCPRFILKYFAGANKKYFCYIFTALIIGVAAIFYNSGIWQQSGIFTSGYSFLSRIRAVLHIGGRCPLCGGTRSFLSLFSGNLREALHYSIFGTFVFFIVYLLLPFRLLLACGVKNYLLNRVKALDWWLEERFLYFLAITSGLQWLLDYLGLWRWYA